MSRESIKAGIRIQKSAGDCRRGHPLTPENTYTAPDGKRTCRTCMRDRWRAMKPREGGGRVALARTSKDLP